MRNSSTERLRRLEAPSWQELLDWCDARQLTFLLPSICGNALPSAVRHRISECRTKYMQRFARLKQELAEVADAFNDAGLNFVLLKGLTHSPIFTPDPVMRAQGDIDLWLRGESVYRAQDVLTRIGYVPLADSKCRHLPPMARRSHWKWRGDRFDPEMPIAVELHYELWSEKTEYIALPGFDSFWDRKQSRTFDGREIDVLRDEDLVGFAALHLLLHVIHGELPMQRAWEIANFLHRSAHDSGFWNSWRQLHPAVLRQAEVLIFCLMRMWFGCDSAPIVQQETAELPSRVHFWLNQFSLSPLKGQFRANKDDLWLHLALVNSRSHRIRVLGRRLAPISIPGFADRAGKTPRLSQIFRQRGLLLSRAAHHAATLLPTVWQGLRWM